MTTITKTSAYGFEAYTIENEVLAAQFVPHMGAKFISLYDKKSKREWLSGPIRTVSGAQYGAVFTDQDMSGWDEMMPTIVACDWEGRHYPDHGEVWAIPWTCEITDDKLVQSVKGVATDYTFRRIISLEADALRFDYQLTNQSGEAFPWLWTAHPQFVAGPDTEMILPDHISVLQNVIENDLTWGVAQTECLWPQAKDNYGKPFALNRVRSVSECACRKHYAKPDETIDWFALRDHAAHCTLHMTWDAVAAPYFGLWVDEGMYNTKYPIAAPEPSSGYYDDLTRAIANQRVPILQPNESTNWFLTLRCYS